MLLKILLTFFSINFAHSAIAEYYQSIFLGDGVTDYCQLKCNGKPHTLCNEVCCSSILIEKIPIDFHLILQTDERNVHERCVNFENIPLTDKMRLELIRGHDSLRNRFAKVLNVSNMKELVWVEEIADLPLNCEPYMIDSKKNFTEIRRNPKSRLGRIFAFSKNGYQLVFRISVKMSVYRHEKLCFQCPRDSSLCNKYFESFCVADSFDLCLKFFKTFLPIILIKLLLK